MFVSPALLNRRSFPWRVLRFATFFRVMSKSVIYCIKVVFTLVCMPWREKYKDCNCTYVNCTFYVMSRPLKTQARNVFFFMLRQNDATVKVLIGEVATQPSYHKHQSAVHHLRIEETPSVRGRCFEASPPRPHQPHCFIECSQNQSAVHRVHLVSVSFLLNCSARVDLI